jgi:hypothetical protein
MKYLSDYTDLPCVANLIADKGDPDGRNVQAGLADLIA